MASRDRFVSLQDNVVVFNYRCFSVMSPTVMCPWQPRFQPQARAYVAQKSLSPGNGLLLLAIVEATIKETIFILAKYFREYTRKFRRSWSLEQKL